MHTYEIMNNVTHIKVKDNAKKRRKIIPYFHFGLYYFISFLANVISFNTNDFYSTFGTCHNMNTHGLLLRSTHSVNLMPECK